MIWEPPGADDDVVAELDAVLAEAVLFGGEIVDDEVDAVPAARIPPLAPSGIGLPAELA